MQDYSHFILKQYNLKFSFLAYLNIIKLNKHVERLYWRWPLEKVLVGHRELEKNVKLVENQIQINTEVYVRYSPLQIMSLKL